MLRILLPDEFVAEGGDALAVVAALKGHALVPSAMPVRDYMDFVQRAVGDVYGIALDVTGTTDAERAKSLVEALVRHGLALEVSLDGEISSNDDEAP